MKEDSWCILLDMKVMRQCSSSVYGATQRSQLQVCGHFIIFADDEIELRNADDEEIETIPRITQVCALWKYEMKPHDLDDFFKCEDGEKHQIGDVQSVFEPLCGFGRL